MPANITDMEVISPSDLPTNTSESTVKMDTDDSTMAKPSFPAMKASDTVGVLFFFLHLFIGWNRSS